MIKNLASLLFFNIFSIALVDTHLFPCSHAFLKRKNKIDELPSVMLDIWFWLTNDIHLSCDASQSSFSTDF